MKIDYHHRKKFRRDAFHALLVLAAGVIVLTIALVSISRWQKWKFAVDVEEEDADEADGEETVLREYQGVTYQKKTGLATYLVMGIDVTGPARSNKSYTGGGQADFQVVVVVDEINQTWQMLHLNRDTMTDVPVLGVMGDVVGTKYEQLALAHAYGDGLESSCENAVNAVSALLGDQEIDGYWSLNMDGVAVLNDAIGGVTLTVLSDFSGVDESLVQGETVTLTGDQALTYVRSRKDVDDQTNLARMKRQRQYMTALFTQCRDVDEETLLEAYDAVADYLVTDMGSKGMSDLSEIMTDYTELDVLTIEGESYLDESGYNAYELDADSLEQAILQLFYEAAE